MSLIFKLLKYLQRKNNQSGGVSFSSYEQQREVLNKVKSPKNLLERSFCQYKCQAITKSLVYGVVENLMALFIIPYYLVKPYKYIMKIDFENRQKNAVFMREGVTLEIIPDSLKNKFDCIYENPLIDTVFLSKDDKKFIWRIIRKYFFKPIFVLKCIIKIGIYSNVIKKYKPNAIITHNEYSYTSSVLTEYCRSIGIEHINVMHGEKLFNIRDSFVAFDRFYVWDQHYVELLIELRAEKEQFRIEKPKSVKIDINNCDNYKYELTYYLGGESEKNLIKLKTNLINTKVPIEKICIRYHPRYCDKKQINYIFDGFAVENPNEIPLNISISQTKYIVSLYSTVLYQAYSSGKEIIIDDVTEPMEYKKLKSLKYIMIDKPHLLLSEIIKLVD